MGNEIDEKLVPALKRLGEMLGGMQNFQSATRTSRTLSHAGIALRNLAAEIESGETKLIITKHRARDITQYLLNLALDFDQLHDLVSDKAHPKRAKK